MKSNSRTDSQLGLTLIELLVALSILSMIVAIAGSTMATSLKAWQSQGKAVQELQTQTAVLQVLRQQLQGALPIRSVKQLAGDSLLAFDGDSRQLHFVSRTSFQEGSNGIPRWIQISWDSSQTMNAGRLVVEERQLLPGNVPGEAAVWKEAVIAANDFHFDYLTKQQSGHPATWLTSWNGLDARLLPAAVRMRFTSRGNTQSELLMKLDYSDSNAQGFWLP